MLRIRPAKMEMEDVALLPAMIREFAEFERELEQVTIREEDLGRDGFGEKPRFRTLIAEWEEQPAGYALLFPYFSTWVGRGMFLEDLFVREKFRKGGIGKVLLAEVARLALDERCYGIHWEGLDWNVKAIELYKALGAEFLQPRKHGLLTGRSLAGLAEQVHPSR